MVLTHLLLFGFFDRSAVSLESSFRRMTASSMKLSMRADSINLKMNADAVKLEMNA